MKQQRGLALSGLILWCIAIILVALLGLKIAPSAIEYYKLQSVIKSVVERAKPEATVAELRNSFDKFAQVEQLAFPSRDLDISKNSRGQIVIAFAYDKKIPLFGNTSLLIEYKGSTAK